MMSTGLNGDLLRMQDKRDRMDAALTSLDAYAELLRKRKNAELRELARGKKRAGYAPGGNATKAELVGFLVDVWRDTLEQQRKDLDKEIQDASRPVYHS